jgi:hypothetical protein
VLDQSVKGRDARCLMIHAWSSSHPRPISECSSPGSQGHMAYTSCTVLVWRSCARLRTVCTGPRHSTLNKVGSGSDDKTFEREATLVIGPAVRVTGGDRGGALCGTRPKGTEMAYALLWSIVHRQEERTQAPSTSAWCMSSTGNFACSL